MLLYKSSIFIIRLFYLIVFILLVNCKISKLEEIHGISNLKLKINEIKINESNQNDIIKIIGPPLIKDIFDKNIWTYYEIKRTTNFFGNKKIILNDLLILKFNSLGILVDYQVFDKNNFSNLKFDDEITNSKAVNKSLSEQFLSSAKKRMDMITNKNKVDQ